MKKIFFYGFFAFFFTSCINVKEIEKSYQMFQTGFDSSSLTNYNFQELKFKEGDNIIVQVYTTATQDQTQTNFFNLPGAGTKAGNYIVDNLGMIELPKMGSVKVVGLSCNQLREMIKNEWSKYVKDIALDVQLSGFVVNVLGEVKVPGGKSFKSEKATIIDAISQAGGLNDEAKRDEVLIVREENGKRNTFKVDLRSADIYKSPAFQLQQNDMIYVAAGERKFKSIQNSRFQQTLTPITSLASFGLAIVNMIVVLFALKNR